MQSIFRRPGLPRDTPGVRNLAPSPPTPRPRSGGEGGVLFGSPEPQAAEDRTSGDEARQAFAGQQLLLGLAPHEEIAPAAGEGGARGWLGKVAGGRCCRPPPLPSPAPLPGGMPLKGGNGGRR